MLIRFDGVFMDVCALFSKWFVKQFACACISDHRWIQLNISYFFIFSPWNSIRIFIIPTESTVNRFMNHPKCTSTFFCVNSSQNLMKDLSDEHVTQIDHTVRDIVSSKTPVQIEYFRNRHNWYLIKSWHTTGPGKSRQISCAGACSTDYRGY